MLSMARIARLAIPLAGACLIAFTASIVLGRLHADAGWYYGLAILLAAIVGLRTLSPGSGVSINGLRRKGPHHHAGQRHLPTIG